MLACEVDAEVLTSVGYPITAEDVMRRFVGMSAADVDAVIARDLGRELPPRYDEAGTQRLFERFRDELLPMAGIAELLDALRAHGVKICVASSSRPPRLEVTLGVTGLWDRLAPNVFSATMVSRGKPAPDLFLLASQRMNVPPTRCLVVEDSATGVTAARAAGMRVVGFTGGSHCREGHSDRLIAAGAQAVYADMVSLGSALQSLMQA